MNLTLAQLQQLAASVGFPDPALAAAVAMAESGGNPTIVGDTGPGVNGPSYGLWQIDVYYHPSYTQAQLDDPTTNARAALAISSNGTNWTPWSTYNSGAYKKWYQPWTSPGLSTGEKLLIAGAAATVLTFGTIAVIDLLKGRPILYALRT